MPAHSARDLPRIIHELFGFDEFRGAQEPAIQAALDGRDVLIVMPTGAGKSLCFQLPAVLTPGVTLVISPLIALMRDQVLALQARPAFRKYGCAYLNSSQPLPEQRQVIESLGAGDLRLLYVAPERFRSSSFRSALSTVKIARVVVDEAHCISEWGHDFRPDYSMLGEILSESGRPPITAATATATPMVRSDILKSLAMRDPAVFVAGFNRPNLHFSVRSNASEDARSDRLIEAMPRLARMGGSGLVYVPTRKMAESLGAAANAALQSQGSRAGGYHAAMKSEERSHLQAQRLSGEIQVLVATSAFGMGIDKPDVRFVVHVGHPESLEAYYQEAGRAGRDGAQSRCVILSAPGDYRLRKWFIDNESPQMEQIETALARIRDWNPDGIATIPRTWWEARLGWNDSRTNAVLGLLERSGLLRRVEETAEAISFEALQPSIPPDKRSAMAESLQIRRERRYTRLKAMTSYCGGRRCRRQVLLSYFGDPDHGSAGHLCCDVCEQPTAAQDAPVRLPAVPSPATVTADIHSLLHALDAQRPPLGRRRLVAILRGKENSLQPSDRRSSLFGLLSHCPAKAVDRFFDRLLSEGLVETVTSGEFQVCVVSRHGRDCWQKKRNIAIVLPGPPASPSTNDDDSQVLIEALRQWRVDQARSRSAPAFTIFSDRTLQALVRDRPQTDEELLNVTGIGPRIAQEYGRSILEIVRSRGGSEK